MTHRNNPYSNTIEPTECNGLVNAWFLRSKIPSEDELLGENSHDNIPTERAVRAYVDNAGTSLQSNIDAEASTREAADGVLQDNIDAEEAARIAADSGIQSTLDAHCDDTTIHLSAVQKTDLTDGGESSAHYHSTDRARANHAGTQPASTISDFDTEVSNNTDVTANTNHRTGDGSDHEDVASNNAHRGTVTGNPHAVTHAELSDKGVNDHTAIDNFIASKGEASGLASLDSMGIIESSQLPSFAPAAVATPVGSIVAVIAGYFGDGNNGSFTAVSLSVSDNWQYCDGSEFYDADSPIYNASGRYLPKLTDSRFIMGSTSAGVAGGNASNQVTLTTTELPSHTHTINHDHGAVSASSVSYQSADHKHYSGVSLKYTGQMITGVSYTTSGSGTAIHAMDGCTELWPYTDEEWGNHNHSVSVNLPNYSGSSGSTGSGSAFSILPLYLTAKYYQRVK